MHGKVKLARSRESGDNVAIKIIPRFSKKRRLGKVTALSPQDKTKKEIAILKKIRHPNVVALIEVIDDPELKKIYMVLEHVELGEIVWRKKGLPHICQYERKRVEREIGGGAPTAEEEQYSQLLERRQAIKELKRAKMAQNFPGPSDYWSNEHGAADEMFGVFDRWSRVSSRDDFAITDGPPSRSASRHSSAAPSRSLSIASTSLMPAELAEDISWGEDLETPGPHQSNPGSTAAVEGASHSAHKEDTSREKGKEKARDRSPSMADSIISHMSSVDYNPFAYDPFSEDYSFVPCFTFDQARSTFRDTVLGLEYLHYQGVVHRDIKPANLLWTRDHRVKISDFGVSYFGRPIRDGEPDDTVSESEARDFDDDLELAKTVGTPAFFAPELCYTDLEPGNQPKVSEQIDVWSLGVTLYCLIFARIPFLAEDEFQMFRKIATEEVHIPRRRLKAVDPSTSPAEHSLFKRQNAHPYRDDNDLEYEDVDNLLYDLLRQMLTKNPDKRIRLRDIKRHPWVVQGIPNVLGWLDDTDPARPSQGRKIQVDEKEMSHAVVPLTFLERARSVMKKAVGKVMQPLVDRSDSRSRRRAISSVASSAGDSMLRHASAGVQPGHDRRPSLRGDDYFATSGRESQVGSSTQAPTAVVSTATTAIHGDSPTFYDPLATVLRTVDASRETWNSAAPKSDNPATACSRRFQRHVGQGRPSSQFLQLSPAAQETQSNPVTPSEGAHAHIQRQGSRRSCDSDPQIEDNPKSTSTDHSLVLTSTAKSGTSPLVSSAAATGTVYDGHGHPRSIKTSELDATAQRDGSFALLSSSPRHPGSAPATSHTNPSWRNQQLAGITQACVVTDSAADNGIASCELEDLTPNANHDPYISHSASVSEINGNKSLPGFQPLPLRDGHSLSLSCPPSPSIMGSEWTTSMPSTQDNTTTVKSSSMESIDAMGTPLTTPSENLSPVNVEPAKTNAERLPTYQSDPSLPALLSGASSVSADMESELLSRSGNPPGQGPRHGNSSEAVTPPAFATETALDKVFGHRRSIENDSPRLHLEHDHDPSSEELDSPTPLVEDEDSDDGIFLMATSKKKASPTTAALSRPFETKRRDTGASTASDETAKKVPVHESDSTRQVEP